MCHSSFDCIDCSKRFETPADYKGHTSCISEAQKYQKSLYSGDVGESIIKVVSIDLTAPQKQVGFERNGGSQQSRRQGGGRQWGNHQQQWRQRSVNQATGANDTPLGTPVRMSPVQNDTPVNGEGPEEKHHMPETVKKRKAEAVESTVCIH